MVDQAVVAAEAPAPKASPAPEESRASAPRKRKMTASTSRKKRAQPALGKRCSAAADLARRVLHHGRQQRGLVSKLLKKLVARVDTTFPGMKQELLRDEPVVDNVIVRTLGKLREEATQRGFQSIALRTWTSLCQMREPGQGVSCRSTAIALADGLGGRCKANVSKVAPRRKAGGYGNDPGKAEHLARCLQRHWLSRVQCLRGIPNLAARWRASTRMQMAASAELAQEATKLTNEWCLASRCWQLQPACGLRMRNCKACSAAPVSTRC